MNSVTRMPSSGEGRLAKSIPGAGSAMKFLLWDRQQVRGSAYFTVANPSAHENSRNSSFGADTFRYVRTEVKGSTSAFESMDVIRSSRMPGDANLMRSRTVN